MISYLIEKLYFLKPKYGLLWTFTWKIQCLITELHDKSVSHIYMTFLANYKCGLQYIFLNIFWGTVLKTVLAPNNLWINVPKALSYPFFVSLVTHVTCLIWNPLPTQAFYFVDFCNIKTQKTYIYLPAFSFVFLYPTGGRHPTINDLEL